MASKSPTNDDLNRNLQKDKIVEALSFKNTMKTFNLNKNNMKAKVDNLLSYHMNGGTFEIDQSLIGFVNYLVQNDKTESVILDKNDLPIYIKDTKKFLQDITDRYFYTMNEYYVEYEQLRSSRKIDVALDIK
jgi:uncharacterized protein YqkB